MGSTWRVVASLCLTLLVAACQRPGAVAPGEGFVAVPGGPAWYRVVGTGKQIPLLLVHGGPGGGSCRFSPLTALGADRPVVFYDQLGSGRSGRPTDMSLWRVERFVDELDAVRRQLGLRDVHLLGHSWGAALVAQYVLTKGTAGIHSVILGGPLLSTGDWIADADRLRQQLPEEVQAALSRHEQDGTTDSPEYAAATNEFYKRFLYHRQMRPDIPECRGSASNDVIYRYMWGPTEFRATGTLKQFDVTARLHEIRVPVLFMVGEFDEARPETVARYQRLIAGSQLAVIPGAGHVTTADAPEQVNETVRSFLARVEKNEASGRR